MTLVFILSFLFLAHKEQEIMTVSGFHFLKNKTSTFFKDEGIEAKYISLLDPTTKKFIVGLIDSTFRNDTLFFHSKITQRGTQFEITEYYSYNIRPSTDSTKRYFSCQNNRVLFRQYEAYKNGAIVVKTSFNKYLN